MRHFDCASAYRNEAAVGRALGGALARGAVRRRELFVTSKLWNADHGRVADACKASLQAISARSPPDSPPDLRHLSPASARSSPPHPRRY